VGVRLAGVRAGEVTVRHVCVRQGRVVMLVLAGGAEVLEPPVISLVAAGDVEVPVAVHQPPVLVLVPPGRGRIFGRGYSFRAGPRITRALR